MIIVIRERVIHCYSRAVFIEEPGYALLPELLARSVHIIITSLFVGISKSVILNECCQCDSRLSSHR